MTFNCEKRELVEWLVPLVEALIRSVDVVSRSIKVKDMDSSAPTYLQLVGRNKCDAFTLAIPYATGTLNWHFLFSWCNKQLPPRIAFGDEKFRPNLASVKTLKQWNPDKTTIFLELIVELLRAYKTFQLEMCRKFERVKFELENLNDLENMDIACVRRNNSSAPDVVFVIKFVVDAVNELPEVFVDDVNIDKMAVLTVRYKINSDTASAELKMSEFLSRIIPGKSNIKLASFSCLLSEYVVDVKKVLAESIYAVCESFKFRRNFMIECCRVFETKLDGDWIFYTRASFLLDYAGFVFILHIKINGSSTSTPNFTLHAISAHYEQKSDQRNSSNAIPYNEKLGWKPKALQGDELNAESIVQDLKAYLEEFAPIFQENASANGC